MIIGITGQKRSGKDTVTAMLTDSYPLMKFERIALADAMKDFTQELLKMPLEDLEYLKDNEDVSITRDSAAVSMRHFLQTLGQGVKEITKDDLVWCKFLVSRLDPEVNYVISDIRFPFEATFFRDWAEGSMTKYLQFKVERKGCEPDGHVSEMFIDEIKEDYLLSNNSTLDALKTSVNQTLISAMLGK